MNDDYGMNLTAHSPNGKNPLLIISLTINSDDVFVAGASDCFSETYLISPPEKIDLINF